MSAGGGTIDRTGPSIAGHSRGCVPHRPGCGVDVPEPGIGRALGALARHAGALAARIARGLGAAPVVLLAACANPPHPLIAPERDEALRSIERTTLEDAMLAPPELIEEAEQRPRAALPAPGPPPDTLELSIEQVRESSLEHNLDLEVDLVEPAILEERVSEEEARFEALFAGSASVERREPASTSLTGIDSRSRSAEAGLVLPLRTGGSVAADLSVDGQDVFGGVAPDTYQTALAFSISQPLLRDAGVAVNTAPITIARLQRRQADARTKLSAIRVVASAERAYWDYYAAVRELSVRFEQLARAELQEQQSRRLAELGVVPSIEVTRARAGVSRRIEDIIVADTRRRIALRNLKRIMNRPDLGMQTPTDVVAGTEPRPLGLTLDTEVLADQAVANRSEMLELELQLAIDAISIDVAENDTLPVFALDYRYSFTGEQTSAAQAFDQLFDRPSTGWRVGAVIEVPLGNQAALSRLRGAVLQRALSLATRQQRAQRIRQEVLDAYDQLQQSWQRILAARQETMLAGETYEAERRQFQAGLRTSTDVLEAADFLADAQVREIRALTGYEIAKIDIAFATGSLLGRGRVRLQPYGLPERWREHLDEEPAGAGKDAGVGAGKATGRASDTTSTRSQRDALARVKTMLPRSGVARATPAGTDVSDGVASGPAVTPQSTASPRAAAPAVPEGEGPATWLARAAPEHFTVQLLATRSEASARAFIDRHGAGTSLGYSVRTQEGTPWYRVVYGEFASYGAAVEAVASLPPELRAGGPWVRRISSVRAGGGE